MASSDVELLQEIVKELKGLRSDLNEFKVETRQGFAELRNDLKFTHSVLGELQGDIEELQADGSATLNWTEWIRSCKTKRKKE